MILHYVILYLIVFGFVCMVSLSHVVCKLIEIYMPNVTSGLNKPNLTFQVPRIATRWQCTSRLAIKVECIWNLTAHGDAREEKWRMEWVASTLTLPRNVVYPALLMLMRTSRLQAVNWTDAPAGLNGLVRFGERRNLVSARVPSRFKGTLLSDTGGARNAIAWGGGSNRLQNRHFTWKTL